MKKVVILSVAVILVVIACQVKSGIVRFLSFNFRRMGTSRVIEHTDNEDLDITYSGTFHYREDGTGITRMSPGAYLDFRKDDRRMVVELKQGRVGYELYDGFRRLPMNEEGRTFIADAVREMIDMGIGARERVEQLYRIGGDSLVLNEMTHLTSDDARNCYANYIMEKGNLPVADMTDILQQTQKMQSDIDKQRMLDKVPVGYLDTPGIGEAYLQVVASIESDIQKEQALHHFTEHPVKSEQYAGVVNVINGIESDIQKEQTIKQLLGRSGVPDAGFDTLLHAIDQIDDEVQKTEILKELLQKDIHTDAHWASLIGSAAEINSDVDKDELLLEISRRMPATPAVQQAYFTAAKTIDDQQAYTRVVSAVSPLK